MKHLDEPDTAQPVSEEASAPPSPDYVTLGIETCVHCEQPKASHRGPMFWCWERTTYWEPGPTRARLTFQVTGLAEELIRAQQERDEARAKLRTVRAHAEDVWFWQGEGDHPESLVCPVVMSADTLREMLATIERLRNDQPWRGVFNWGP